jgi:hypothetical protein
VTTCLHFYLECLVREAEFPVLIRLINAVEESLSLLFLQKVEKNFDCPCSVMKLTPRLVREDARDHKESERQIYQEQIGTTLSLLLLLMSP